MPPLVTVSAALLSTNTLSKSGRNFLKACPAMTLAFAATTAAPDSELGPLLQGESCWPAGTREKAAQRAGALSPPSVRGGGHADARADWWRGLRARGPTRAAGGGRKGEHFLGFSRPAAEVKERAPLPEMTPLDLSPTGRAGPSGRF